MVFIRSFCFYFTIRLGSIIVGVLSSLESLVGVGMTIAWLYRGSHYTRDYIKHLLDNYQVTYTSTILNSIHSYPDYYIKGFFGFATFHLITSLLLIYASYNCYRIWIGVWLMGDIVRLVLLLAGLVSTLLTIKENDSDLGLLIPATLLSSFFIMYLIYCWTCPLSLYQALSNISKVSPSVQVVATVTTLGTGGTGTTRPSDLYHYHHYLNPYNMTALQN